MKPIGYTALIKTFQLDVLTPWMTSYLLERGDRRSRTVGCRREEFFPARYLRGGEQSKGDRQNILSSSMAIVNDPEDDRRS
jgi:hypothetical protein